MNMLTFSYEINNQPIGTNFTQWSCACFRASEDVKVRHLSRSQYDLLQTNQKLHTVPNIASLFECWWKDAQEIIRRT